MSDIQALFEVPQDDRDEKWEQNVLRELPKVQIKLASPEARPGPDQWPYMMVTTGEGADEPLLKLLGWLSTRGIGLAVNPQKPSPDFVLTYGMVWNYRERGEFISDAPEMESGEIEIEGGEEVMVGPPSEAYLPKYARGVIKQFLMDQGILAPKVAMVSFDKEHYELCFSIESLKSPPEEEHAGIAEALSWFVPAHYVVSLVSEKAIPGFEPL